jgi:hypothetical protein
MMEGTEEYEIDPHDQLRIIALEMERSEFSIKTQRKLQFIQSLRVVPLELFEQILILAVEDGTSKQTLQSVCKCWREAVLNIPRLWSNISVEVPRSIIKSVPFLKRRIELSKGAPLNVTLSARCGERKLGIIKTLHSLVFATGTDRWRSLTILDGENEGLKEWITSSFHGEFPSLEELDIQYLYNPGIDIYNPIYDSIGTTANHINSCCLVEGQTWPEFLERLPDFHSSLVTAKVGIPLVEPLKSPNLLNLELRGSLPIVHLPELDFPPNLSLPSLSLDLFQHHKFDRVTHLTVHRIDAERSRTIWTATLSALLSLKCLTANLSGLPCIRAPHLQYLYMGEWPSDAETWGGRRRANDESQETTNIFQAKQFSVHIKPTSVHLESFASVQLLCIILKKWPQIEYLSIGYGQYQDELKELEASLTARGNISDDNFSEATWSLCPVLITLHIETDDEDGYENWRSFGQTLTYARRNAPFRRFTWGNKDRLSTLVESCQSSV